MPNHCVHPVAPLQLTIGREPAQDGFPVAAKSAKPLARIERPVRETSVQDEPEPPGDTDRGGANRRNLVGLAVVVALALLGWLLIRELQAKSKLEDCLLSGRRDCAPIETQN